MGQISLPVASYNEPSRAPLRLVNVYPEQLTAGKQPVGLNGAPGASTFAALGNGPGRGLFVMRGVLYAVSGQTFYKVDEFGSETQLGTLPGTGKLMFAGNGSQIVFSNKYIFQNGTVGPITDPDFPAVSAIDYTDGYVVWAESGTQRWGSSKLHAGQDYDPLDTASAEVWPDDIVTLKVSHRQVVLFGQERSEVWWNSAPQGGTVFPFELLAGGDLELGCLARLGVARQDNSLIWLASDRTIRRLQGQTPVRVSQHGVERKIASYARIDDCEAFPMSWNGHLWVVFNFPSARGPGVGATWVYDVTVNEWHERASYGLEHWAVVDAASCYGQVFVQSTTTGAIGKLSDSVHTEFGNTLRKEWTYPQVYDTNSQLVHSSLELVAHTGTAPLGQIAHVHLDLSDDGGNTWLSLPPRTLGRTGEYDHEIRWNRLGQARDRVYRMSVDDAHVPVSVTDTILTVA
jgi:hypothetical protein